MTADPWGSHWGELSAVCPRCAALVHPSDEGRATHTAFHNRVEPERVSFRRVDTPLGERIAYVPAGVELPDGWTDLGPYGQVTT